MAFQSVLFDHPRSGYGLENVRAPEYFRDLNLGPLVEAITAGHDEYNLEPFFFTPLEGEVSVRYRQAVFRDFAERRLLLPVTTFARAMRAMREHLTQADKLRHPLQRQRWFFDAATVYRRAVSELAAALPALQLRSDALTGFCGYLDRYTATAEFERLATDIESVRQALATVTYCVEINGNRVHLDRYADQADYSDEVQATFDKFNAGATQDYRSTFRDRPDMNHVETQIVDLVARLHPGPFGQLETFAREHAGYLDETISAFDREVQFYVAYLDHLQELKAAGLTFSLPDVSVRSKQESATGTFDLALATQLVRSHADVVVNDYHLDGVERIIVVTGPNQGGKTTLARTFGQLHHLGALGCPVPGRDVKLFLPDRIFTHFEREEDLSNLSGKLQDDLMRVHDILEQATSSSVVILNEIFTSTSLDDAVALGSKVLRQLIDRDLLAVCVTFVDEWASLGPATVSMISTVDPDDPAVRTFRVVRRPSDGLAHAAALAAKYGLTYERLTDRIAR